MKLTSFFLPLLLLFLPLFAQVDVGETDFASRRRGTMRQLSPDLYAELTYRYDELRLYLMNSKRQRVRVRNLQTKGTIEFPEEFDKDPLNISFEPKGDHYKANIIIDPPEIHSFTLNLEVTKDGETFEAQFTLKHPPKKYQPFFQRSTKSSL